MPDSSKLSVLNRLESVQLGVVRAQGIDVSYADPEFDASLRATIEARAGGLSDAEDARRRAVRDMLRNGTYKPTGRGKPASEYLLRAATDPSGYPRINWPVDVCNFISLKSLFPVSIWDEHLAEARSFVFRLGMTGESYVFNPAGQEINLLDLVAGCAVRSADDTSGTPIVNPIKDSLATKTTEASKNVVAVVYAPAGTDHTEALVKCCEEFRDLLVQSSAEASGATTVIDPGEESTC